MTAVRPPGPKNPPIIGNLVAFRSDPLGFLGNATREYGDLVYFKVARQHMYLVNHPDYVREILVANQGNFIKSRALQRAKILLGEDYSPVRASIICGSGVWCNPRFIASGWPVMRLR